MIDAIQSALNQSYPVHEILVCDDGSTDDSSERVRAMVNPKVKWLSCGRNGMPSIPRNKGMQAAEGEWFAFLDSDDSWTSDKIEKQFLLLNAQKAKAVSSNAIRMDSKGINLGPYQKEVIPDVIKTEHLLKTNLVICSSAMIHSSLLKVVFGFPESKKLKAIEDYTFWLRVSTQTNFVYSSECLVNYLDDSASSIRSEDDDTWIQRERIFDDFYRWCAATVGLDNKYLKSAKSEVKRAMKMNGVGIFKRWTY